ncbi:flagellar basal-body MS-ring/collar protein FliF [Cellvibrio sp. PSBB006]|uniref:flagellar basal-body MS-ring/collar protein FliF n=1 Tax=Cellvibrio sp. PSBB006 TaxID=1987723 RepID=UPI000B3B7E6C|nr:flagellar basal-body MS-ring/collar protein FliF [Cellvibrio sp. PSBB006]ARU26861.1 flagellar M-ring protein FliF [Cellvibrio sp. PSBB006]
MASTTDNADANNVPARSEKPRLGGDFAEGFSSLSLLRQAGLMVGLAASVAIGFAVVLWSQGEDYRPLYGSLNNLDAANVVQVLDQNQIKYKLDINTGAVLVAADDVHMARLRLAELGIPGKDNTGFELLDQEQPLGTSQFMENTRYHRGLEGELARTITSITSIRKARVHLAIPKRSVFVRDVRKPTASVFVEVFAGRTVEPAQVRAITNLVASSIPELNKEDVTVVDQHGSLLSTGDENDELLLAGKQHTYTQAVEESLIKRVNSILLPVVGNGNFRAEVSADIDFTAIEQAAETFNPDLPAVRSEQTLNEERVGGDIAGGIPGALTNQPPGTTTQVPEQLDPVTGEPIQPEPPRNSREQATRNYELDRTISYTRHQQGTLKRLTVAVVVDDKIVKDAEGNDTRVPWTENELERLSILVRDAVGFSAVRGDSVNVLNSPFMGADDSLLFDTTAEEVPWWETWILPNIKYLSGVLIVLLLIFGLLLPVFRSLTRSGQQLTEQEEARQLAALEAAGLGYDGMSDETVTLTGGSALMLPGPEQGYEQQLNAIKGLIADDPGRVAQVVKKWINKDE